MSSASAAPAHHHGRLTLSFEQRSNLEEHFEPLRLPDLLAARAEGLNGNQIEALHSEVQVALQAGDHALPVGRRQPLLLRIAQGTVCHIQVRTGRAPEAAPARAMVQEAGLRFDPPVALHDVAPTLLGLQELFADRDAIAVRRFAAGLWASQPAARLQDAALQRIQQLERDLEGLSPMGLPLGAGFAGARGVLTEGLKLLDVGARKQISALRDAIEDNSPRLPVVHLARVSARPVQRRQGWRLELRFSGEWGYEDVCMFPFDELRLPALVLPAPHALLESLLSDQPLESAVVDADSWPIHAMAKAIAGAVRELTVRFEADLRLPALGISLPMSDRGVLSADVTLPDALHASGALSVDVQSDRISGQIDGLEVRGGDGALNAGAGFALTRADGLSDDGPLLAWLLETLVDGRWPAEHVVVRATADIAEGSTLPTVAVSGQLHHPLARGGVDLDLAVEGLELRGSAAVRTAGRTLVPDAIALAFTATARTGDGTRFGDGVALIEPRVEVHKLSGGLSTVDGGGLALTVAASGDLQVDGAIAVEAFPELSIEEGQLQLDAAGSFTFEGSARTSAVDQPPVRSDFSGTRASLTLAHAAVSLGARNLSLPHGSQVWAALEACTLATTGLGQAHIALAWDLKGASPMLRAPGHEVAIFVPELRQGAFDVHISPVGGMRFSGEDKGLYDFRLFNALINPGAELDRWVELLGDDEAIEHILAAVKVFSPDLEHLMGEIRGFARRLTRVLDEEGIERPGDFLPAATMARVLSRVLADSLEPEQRIYKLVMDVVEGRGLDVPEVKQLLTDVLPEHEHAFEIDRILRIVSRAVTPTEPVPPFAPEKIEPLTERPALMARFRGLPDAAELFRVARASAPLPAGFSAMVARIAPYLTQAQLTSLLQLDRDDWRPQDRVRLRAVCHLKERIALIAEECGGIAFIPQALAIGFFIGRATSPALDVAPGPWPAHDDGQRYPLATSLLGPAEVATLLHAGLASMWQGSPVQVNQRLLLEVMLRQPPTFVREVLVEMSSRSPQALTGVLYGLLDIEQQRMNTQIDVSGRLAEALGLPIPRLRDYMAGGRWARQSHYEALFKVAEHILAESTAYQGLCQHLQVVRHRPPPPCTVEGQDLHLADRAQKAIARADRVSALCTFRGHEPGRRQDALQAWDEAFAACRALLAAQPQAFQLDWFKHFWGRNYEALMVRSVVRNVQDKVDRVPQWLQARIGRKPPRTEQGLIAAVVEALYTFEADRAQLLADPLVRLLIDPPEGQYDFTVISAMGVITEGAAGTELKDAYARLEAERGVKVIRANTQTARTLEFNAARIEEAVRQAKTPWGWIGYSQGCANGLRAESLLLSGTPEQQELARGLRCRNLLFSAANGSAHGTCGDWKLQRIMADADRFLKHYQAVFSERAIQAALRNIRAVLDSPPWVRSMGGMQSLSHDGVRTLARDGQFKADVPTSIIRGVVEPSFLPEALEMLSNALEAQTETALHDTQVTWQEAVGHPVWVISPWGEILRRCDTGCMVQRTHHWSPLLYATEFVTTVRDRAAAVYDFPKDRHVFPWVEVNARFGVIRARG